MPESLLEPASRPHRRDGLARPGRSLRALVRRRPLQIAATVLAVAAVVVFLSVSPFGQKASFAFGDVQKALSATKSMTYQCLIFNGDEDPIVIKVSCLGGDRSRAEISGGEVQIINRKEEATMTLSRTNRTAVIRSIYASPEFAKMMTESFARFRTLPAQASRQIAAREYKGRKVIDFRVKLDDRDYTVTVDSETKLPVRMEFATEKLAATGRRHRELWADFTFDLPLDESLFAMTPPPGYTVQRLSLPKGTPPDDSSLVVSPETGIGPVGFGTPQEDIVKLLGKPDQITTSESTMPPQTDTGRYSKPQTYYSAGLNYDLRGFALTISSRFKIGETTYPGYGLLGIRVFNDVDFLPTHRPFQGKTREGIRLGATPDEVRKVYGKPDAQNDGGSYAALTYQKRGWIFEFRHGKLTSISVHSPLPADELRPRKFVGEQVPAERK